MGAVVVAVAAICVRGTVAVFHRARWRDRLDLGGDDVFLDPFEGTAMIHAREVELLVVRSSAAPLWRSTSFAPGSARGSGGPNARALLGGSAAPLVPLGQQVGLPRRLGAADALQQAEQTQR